jgi:hypothetical protein
MLIVLNDCYHVCLEGANLAKSNDTRIGKAKTCIYTQLVLLANQTPQPNSCMVQSGIIFAGTLQDMVDGVTWPTTLPPGWTVEWDAALVGEEQEE